MNLIVGRKPVLEAINYGDELEQIYILYGLKGNIIVNGMDPEKSKIVIASASWASRPMRSRGRQAKRTNVILKAREVEAKK